MFEKSSWKVERDKITVLITIPRILFNIRYYQSVIVIVVYLVERG